MAKWAGARWSALIPYGLLAVVIGFAAVRPGPPLWGEWESLTVFAIFGEASTGFSLSIAPRANIGGQGYAFLEVSQWLLEYAGLPPTLATIRLPAVMFGAASLLLFFVLAKRWFGPWAALGGTSLLAVNPIFSQYQHELIIAGPSLTCFMLLLERVQNAALRPRAWASWITLGVATALVLLVYGPGRIVSLAVLGGWGAKLLWQASRGARELTLSQAGLRLIGVGVSAAVLLALFNLRNVRFFGPSLLFPRNSENILVTESSLSSGEVVRTNAQIIAESILLGGGEYHSTFLEATLIQGRFPMVPLMIVPFYLAGLVVAAIRTRGVSQKLNSPYIAVLTLTALTLLPMLASSVFLLQAGDSLGQYQALTDTWVATLVNHRLAYFLIPAYLAIVVLMEWSLSRGRVLIILTAVIAIVLTLVGASSITRSRVAFVERASTTDPTLVGLAGSTQWLAGYSLADKPPVMGSHFQQHEQYARWAKDAAAVLQKVQRPGAVTVASTRISCFPEAALQTLSLGDIPGRNYHNVYLATYLSDHLRDSNIGYVHVPPVGGDPRPVGDSPGYYSAELILGLDGVYDYVDFDGDSAVLRSLAGGPPNILIATTPTELALAEMALEADGLDYVVVHDLPCWS